MFTEGKSVEAIITGEGVTRKLLSRGGSMMMSEMAFKKGAIGEVHSHAHEQMCYIVAGRFEFNLDDQIQIIKKGDSVYVPSNSPHSVKALEDVSIILDIFTPQREDFL
ncbi:cupin domain-containing protein [Jeotgalibacillus soli]|uniref:Pectin degradation protein kdgF n=1 Tax=Jeotgalibacillus soli TaxID=889306 RepID=A0A0C2SDU9_9BACL|nr:cupin domain-containing protein [Jeotgalibacillus soli]KIL52124.1 pectin degradation protein kdgF [Jeotgalibacillus soli]